MKTFEHYDYLIFNDLQKDALIFIASKGFIHSDIKPANIFVLSRDGRLRAFVGDFGLTDKSGGTPIFMAPEGLSKDSRVIAMTDLYSFAMTVLFLMFPAELAINLLFIPISDDSKIFMESLCRFPLLQWIFDCLKSDPAERPISDSWKFIEQQIRNFDKKWLINQIDTEILEQNGVNLDHLDKAIEEVFCPVNSGIENKEKCYHLSKAVSHFLRDSRLRPKEDDGGKSFLSTAISQVIRPNQISQTTKAKFSAVSQAMSQASSRLGLHKIPQAIFKAKTSVISITKESPVSQAMTQASCRARSHKISQTLFNAKTSAISKTKESVSHAKSHRIFKTISQIKSEVTCSLQESNKKPCLISQGELL